MSAAASARARSAALGPLAVVVWAVGAIVVLVALALWQRNGYWEYSDGVYALTARLVAGGSGLYGDVAGAQPPPIYLFGAAVLSVDDSLTALRAALAAVELTTSALVLVVVWRLTGQRSAAVLAALLALVTPWTLREHAQLLPETFAAPLLLGAALASGRARRATRAAGSGAAVGAAGSSAAAGAGEATRAAGSPSAAGAAGSSAAAGAAGGAAASGTGGGGADGSRGASGTVVAGALGALAAAFKLAFGLPALAILLAIRLRGDRVRGLLAFAGTGLVLALAALAGYGGDLLDGAVGAQRESGLASLSYVAGLWAQGAWNLLPLLACAALAWPLRARIAEPELQRALAAAALGALLLFLSLFKSGSYLTIVVVAEPPLLCLAAAGVVAALRADAAPFVALAAIAALFGALQVGSLLAAPGDPALFMRPLAASGPARVLSPAEVDRAVATIRACPADRATSGPPYLAFVAGRRIGGDQPDEFILGHAASLSRFRARVAADQPRCP